jgi:hypothetical protein
MSQLTLTILDSRRAIHSQPHGSFACAVVAALSADPETIEELESAVVRFWAPAEYGGFFTGWPRGVDDQPHDAGVCIIDLAARLVACESTYASLHHHGEVNYHDGRQETNDCLPFDISHDWQFTREMEDWQFRAQWRRQERTARPRPDFRAVLFGPPLLEYVARECLAARESGGTDVVAGIHARWLSLARSDLGARAPRDWLLADLDHIDMDLHWRGQQWVLQGRCPPPLSRSTSAYRYGGCGSHEVVLYYDLVRHLLSSCWPHGMPPNNVTAAEEITQLMRLRDTWLVTPQPDRLHGRTPRQIVDDERRRIPQAMSGHDLLLEHDCPLDAVVADVPGPVFWQLDSSHLDDDFVFSFYKDRYEWESEQRQWLDIIRQGSDEPARPDDRSTSRPEALPPGRWRISRDRPRRAAAEIQLLRIGTDLAELLDNCQKLPEGDTWQEQLRRQYDNLLTVVCEKSEAILGGAVIRLQTSLGDLADRHASLKHRCDEMIARIDELAARLSARRD